MKIKKKVFVIVPVVIALIVFLGLYAYLNYEDDKTSLTVGEKRWISSNNTKKYDFEIVNNIPVYSMDGSGVVFNLIDSFEIDTELEFNKISYLKESQPTTSALRFRILDNKTELTDKDLLLFEDGYVAISKSNTRYNKVSDISNKVVGTFTSDVGELSYYLKTGTELTYKTYDDIDSMIDDLEDGTISMIVIPQILYLDKTIINDNYYINYYFTEMSKKIVLTLTDDNENLNKIVKKYYEKWKNEKYVDVYNKEYLNYYVAQKGMNDKAKADLVSKTYVYGYVENKPYEVDIERIPSGIASEYIARMKRLTGIEFVYKKYNSLKDLKKAIDNGKVDVYFNYFDYTNKNYKETISPIIEEYVVLGTTNNGKSINSFESLKGEKVNMLSNNLLLKYFEANSKAIIKEVKNVDKLTKNDNLIVVDKEVYDYYKNTKFSKYEVLYSSTMSNEYTFYIKNDDSNFYKLFNYIITTNSYYNYRLNGIKSLNLTLIERTNFQELYLIVLGLALLPLLALIAIYLLFRRKHRVKEVKKEDRRKYTDLLTSLKNRNYLNLNIETWENSRVYPQSVVIIDLNNVKYVNDNYGHEAGDQLIIAAASTLVNTQLENSEIIRTDGNEFLIYLVGYTDKQIETYCKKLAKELKDLPHGFGAAVGYSMIMDDIKTIDDAINEAALDMRTAKEKIK